MSTVNDALIAALTSLQSQMMNTLAAVLPIAFAILGAGILIMYGISVFRKVTGAKRGN